MFCGNCGKQIVDNSRFCPYCGAEVGKSENILNKPDSVYQPGGTWSYGTGAKIWLGFCTIGQGISSLSCLVTGQFLLFLVAVFGAGCYAVLWLKKDVRGFWGVCAAQVIMMLFNLYYGTGLLMAIVPGIANMLVSLMVINKYYGILKGDTQTVHGSEIQFNNKEAAGSEKQSDILSLIMGVIICFGLYMDWIKTDLVVANFGCSLMKMTEIVQSIREGLWLYANDSAFAFYEGIAIGVVIIAYLVLLLEIVYCVLLGMKLLNKSDQKACTLIGRIASRLAFSVSVAFIGFLLYLNIRIASEISGSWFNQVIQIAPAPFIVLGAAITQMVLLNKKKYKGINKSCCSEISEQ